MNLHSTHEFVHELEVDSTGGHPRFAVLTGPDGKMSVSLHQPLLRDHSRRDVGASVTRNIYRQRDIRGSFGRNLNYLAHVHSTRNGRREKERNADVRRFKPPVYQRIFRTQSVGGERFVIRSREAIVSLQYEKTIRIPQVVRTEYTGSIRLLTESLHCYDRGDYERPRREWEAERIAEPIIRIRPLAPLPTAGLRHVRLPNVNIGAGTAAGSSLPASSDGSAGPSSHSADVS
jgi:hypothetical protein